MRPLPRCSMPGSAALALCTLPRKLTRICCSKADTSCSTNRPAAAASGSRQQAGFLRAWQWKPGVSVQVQRGRSAGAGLNTRERGEAAWSTWPGGQQGPGSVLQYQTILPANRSGLRHGCGSRL